MIYKIAILIVLIFLSGNEFYYLESYSLLESINIKVDFIFILIVIKWFFK